MGPASVDRGINRWIARGVAPRSNWQTKELWTPVQKIVGLGLARQRTGEYHHLVLIRPRSRVGLRASRSEAALTDPKTETRY
jgi:hypothetical protein